MHLHVHVGAFNMQRGRKHQNSEGAYWHADKLQPSSRTTCGLLRESEHRENFEILGALRCIQELGAPKLYS